MPLERQMTVRTDLQWMTLSIHCPLPRLGGRHCMHKNLACKTQFSDCWHTTDQQVIPPETGRGAIPDNDGCRRRSTCDKNM